MLFYKMEGNGNDFVVVDNREGVWKESHKSLMAKRICDRRFGVGADGLLFVERSLLADFRMRLFNADGSEAEMCGNGARCMARFCREIIGVHKDEMDIYTAAGIVHVWFDGESVKIGLGRIEHKGNLLNDVDGEFIIAGVPHYVIEVASVESVDVDKLGRDLRNRREFVQGTNVDFVEVIDRKSIRVRTYERGVEAETLSCGTGASASAYAMYLRKKVDFPVVVFNRGGTLKIDVEIKNDVVKKVFLTGNARFVFKGELLDE